MLDKISDVFDDRLELKKDSFKSFVCDESGEMTAE
jgi:hypothetical protein